MVFLLRCGGGGSFSSSFLPPPPVRRRTRRIKNASENRYIPNRRRRRRRSVGKSDDETFITCAKNNASASYSSSLLKKKKKRQRDKGIASYWSVPAAATARRSGVRLEGPPPRNPKEDLSTRASFDEKLRRNNKKKNWNEFPNERGFREHRVALETFELTV